MTVLVTGATGNIGRKVVEYLLARGERDIRALSYRPDKANLPPEIEVVTGYLRHVDSLDGVFDGIDRMYLAPTPETVDEVLATARRAGVQHVVDLSGEPDSWWGTVTHAVENCGIGWTHLWPGDFMENTTTWAEQIRRTGAVHEPDPDAASAPIAMDDIAAVAATALLDERVRHTAHLLTGPETVTRRQLVAHIAAAIGREIPFVTSGRDETIEQLTPAMGEHTEWYVDNVLIGYLDEDEAQHTTTVADIIGRPATRYADWAVDNADEFR